MAKQLTIEHLTKQDPDLVDRIFEYIFADPALADAVQRYSKTDGNTMGKIKDAVRAEFNGERCYIVSVPTTQRQQLVSQVLALFDGRNATEVARTLNISRPTVYRYLKQARQPK